MSSHDLKYGSPGLTKLWGVLPLGTPSDCWPSAATVGLSFKIPVLPPEEEESRKMVFTTLCATFGALSAKNMTSSILKIGF